MIGGSTGPPTEMNSYRQDLKEGNRHLDSRLSREGRFKTPSKKTASSGPMRPYQNPYKKILPPAQQSLRNPSSKLCHKPYTFKSEPKTLSPKPLTVGPGFLEAGGWVGGSSSTPLPGLLLTLLLEANRRFRLLGLGC